MHVLYLLSKIGTFAKRSLQKGNSHTFNGVGLSNFDIQARCHNVGAVRIEPCVFIFQIY